MSKWEKVKIEEVCEILDSMRIPVTASDRKSGVYPYYGANGVQGYVSNYIFDDELVLLAEDGGNFGSKTRPIAYRVSGKCWINNHAHVLKAKPTIDVEYLCYSIMFYDVSKIISGTTRAKLNQAAMRKMTIPLPPLETQKLIAKTLDATSELLNMHKQQLAELDNLIKSTFYNMFGDPFDNDKRWRILGLVDVATIDTKLTKEFDKYAEYPHIGIDSIEKSTGNIVDYKLVKDSNIISGKYLFSNKHIIYSKIRPNLNKVALPTFCGLCSADAYPILPKENISNKYYLAYILRSDFFLNYILDFSGRTNIPKVNKQQLGGFQLPIPPISLQTQFAEIVTKIEEQKALVRKAIDETQYLFDSLISDYFE